MLLVTSCDESRVFVVESVYAVEITHSSQELTEDKDLRAKFGVEGLYSVRRLLPGAAIVRLYREMAERRI
jgi:hypothetical protein